MASSLRRRSLKHKLTDSTSDSTTSAKKKRVSSLSRTSKDRLLNDSGLGTSCKKKPKDGLLANSKNRTSVKRKLLDAEHLPNEDASTDDLPDSGLGESQSSAPTKKKLKMESPESVIESPKKNCAMESPKRKSVKRSRPAAKTTEPAEPINIANMDISQILALGEGTSTPQSSILPANNQMSDSEDTDWEEVAVKHELKEPVIPVDGVNITLPAPSLSFKRQKRGPDLEGELRRQLKRRQKEIQELMHKVHLLCWIAHIKFVNSVLNSEEVLSECHKVLSSKQYYPPKHADLIYLERIVKVFWKHVALKEQVKEEPGENCLKNALCSQFQNKTAWSKNSLVFMFVIFLRSLGVKTRLVMSFVTVPLKPSAKDNAFVSKPVKESKKQDSPKESPAKTEPSTSNAKKNILKSTKKSSAASHLKTKTNKSVASGSAMKEAESVTLKNEAIAKPKAESSTRTGSLKKNLGKNLVSPQPRNIMRKRSCYPKLTKSAMLDNDSDSEEEQSKHFRDAKMTKKSPVVTMAKKLTKKGAKVEASTSKSPSKSSGDDFSPTKKQTPPVKKKLDRRVLSSDDENLQCDKKKIGRGQDVWVEVFLEAEEKWITVDIVRQKVHCVQFLYGRATQPVTYVIACNNDSTLKDVTRRYVPHWHSDTRKRRVVEEWWADTIWPYAPPATAQDKEEDDDIARQLHDMPLPKSISEYKAHPLYALKRHLLKFEGIYPPDAPTLGFVRGEPVYGRECVVTLRSREIWFKEARVVRLNETPYKIVKSRPKYDKMTGEFKKDLPLEVFGVWQTEDFIPPIAMDGKVPRNEYGNVDLFKPCMLPIGTVHLQIPALIRVARKLNIDCAPAVVGFEFHSGGSHPVHDGFVVCEEFKEQLLDAWNKDIDESAKRAEEKRDKRVWGNWRRVIRGLLIRENLKMKYSFGENSDGDDNDEEGDRLDDPPAPSTSKPSKPPPAKKKRFRHTKK